MEHKNLIDNLAHNKAKGDIKHLNKAFKYLLPYKYSLLAAFIALVITSSCVLAIGKGLGLLVDKGFGTGSTELLTFSLIILLATIFVLAMATFARFYFITYVGERVVADIRKDIYRHIIALSAEFFETNKTGETLSRLTTDTTLLQVVIGSSMSVALRNLILLIGGIVMLVVTSAKLSAYMIIILPLVVFPIIIIGRKVRKLSRQSQDKVAIISSHAEESLNGIKTIQAYNREDFEKTVFAGHVEDALKAAMQRVAMRALLTALVILFVFSAIAAVLFIGGNDVITGTMSAGDLTSFLFYSAIVAGAVGAISEVLSDLQKAAGAAERIFELLKTKPKVKAKKHVITSIKAITGRIKFNNVSFSYPTRLETKALDKFTLSIPSGKTIAFAGASGAGKSTIFNLLLRFYDPIAGEILIDDINIKDLSLRELRENFAIVTQDPVIFSTTALENIKFAKPDAGKDEVIKAAKAAAALEFIEKMPKGFNTFLGEKGIRISGGQKQRIAIARAFLKDPKILLLDEATSSLDNKNEKLVQKALDNIMKGRTTLIIAHRLSTIEKADKIIVLDNGKIVETGSYKTLMSKKGFFYKLANTQLEAT